MIVALSSFYFGIVNIVQGYDFKFTFPIVITLTSVLSVYFLVIVTAIVIKEILAPNINIEDKKK